MKHTHTKTIIASNGYNASTVKTLKSIDLIQKTTIMAIVMLLNLYN